MSYTGIHRRSPLGEIGARVATVLEFGVIVWLTFEGFRRLRDAPNILLFEAALGACVIAAVVIHESGHLLVGLAGGEPVRKLRIGSGPTLFGFRVGSLPMQVCLNLLGGGAVYFSSASGPRGKRLASLLAGPLVNLLAGSYSLFLYQYTGAGWLGVFALANTICFLSSAIPSTSRARGVEHPSDGMQIFRMLAQADTVLDRMPNFEAAVMTDGAHDVLLRAAEDALLSGSDEITDQSLLRALSQDGAVGDLFASVGLAGKIPPPPLAESDAVVQPRFSTSARAALEAAEQHGRELGIDRLTPQAICLGLITTDCAAGRVLKEAGISENVARKLASVAKADGEDPVQHSVITPDLPLERWGSAADNALAYAARVAVADRSPVMGTQHLLAALVADPNCRAAQALARTGFILQWKPEQSEGSELEPGEAARGPVLSPELGVALAGALWRTGPTFPAGTAELCLGILDQNAGEGAAILVSSGVTVQAVERALRATAREPSYPVGCTATSRWLWMLRSQARDRAGRWLDARADLVEVERTATMDQERALWRNNIAWASLMSGDPTLRAESLALARFAVSVKPEEPSYIGTLAFALLENGSPGEAAAMLESSLPKVTRPRSRAFNLCELAMCYGRLSQPAAAAKNLAAATEADPGCPLIARARAELGTVAA